MTVQCAESQTFLSAHDQLYTAESIDK